MTPEQVAAVCAEARSWLNTPYVHHARVKGHGVDCVHMPIAVYAACGVIEDFDPGFYTADWFLHRSEEIYLAGVAKYADQVEVGEAGDLAMYRYGKTVSHSGIILSPGVIIHAHRPARQVELCDMISLAHRFDSCWRPR